MRERVHFGYQEHHENRSRKSRGKRRAIRPAGPWCAFNQFRLDGQRRAGLIGPVAVQISEVCDPKPVRSFGGEITLNEVWRTSSLLAGDCGYPRSRSPLGFVNAVLAHDPSDFVTADVNANSLQRLPLSA